MPVPALAYSLHETPELQQLALNFLVTFFTDHFTQQPPYISTRSENFYPT